MEEPMAQDDRSLIEEPFRELEAQLAALRTASKALRDEAPSWSDNIFHPGRRARQEADFGAAVVSALKQFGSSVRTLLAQQESKFAELERQISELKAGQREQAEAANRAVEQVGRDHAAKVAEIAAAHKDLANEFSERIQHLLDEQRVSIRQLALKASEDAVLSDRARRATELKLEELTKRLPPASPA
jgi:2,4-dienoyl-CoA reductase-like NADH-dependent reductase (Old Yellow Enzyme family)